MNKEMCPAIWAFKGLHIRRCPTKGATPDLSAFQCFLRKFDFMDLFHNFRIVWGNLLRIAQRPFYGFHVVANAGIPQPALVALWARLQERSQLFLSFFVVAAFSQCDSLIE